MLVQTAGAAQLNMNPIARCLQMTCLDKFPKLKFKGPRSRDLHGEWSAFIQRCLNIADSKRSTIMPNIHPFLHKLTAVSTMQGDSQLVRAVGCLALGVFGRPRRSARRSQGSNKQVASQPTLPPEPLTPDNTIILLQCGHYHHRVGKVTNTTEFISPQTSSASWGEKQHDKRSRGGWKGWWCFKLLQKLSVKSAEQISNHCIFPPESSRVVSCPRLARPRIAPTVAGTCDTKEQGDQTRLTRRGIKEYINE